MSVFHLRKDSPFRPPDWRWARAELLRSNPRLVRKFDPNQDGWVQKAKQFQAAYDRCQDEADLARLWDKYPHLFEARDIHFNDDQLIKWELQARLLSGDSFENISKRLSLSEDTINCYEKLFFNVLDRLDNRGYVVHRIFGESAHAGLTERDYDLLWKMYGYFGGPTVLDAVIDKCFDVQRPETADQVPAFAADDIQNTMMLKGMIASRTMPVNSYTQQIILEIYQKFLELKQQVEGSRGLSDMLSANIHAALENIPWAIGSSAVLVSAKSPEKPAAAMPPLLIEADRQPVEMRVDDLTKITTQQAAEIPEYVLTHRFPERDDEERPLE